jgi:uncharacterized protein YkwD
MTDDELSMYSLISAERSKRGLRPLTHSDWLRDPSVQHSKRMRYMNDLHHSNLSRINCDCSKLGECVGVGHSVSAIFLAFMNSTPHRNVLMGNFAQVGIGIVPDSRRGFWVTVTVSR